VIPILKEINAAYDPSTLHNRTDLECKEFNLGRPPPRAEDRVMERRVSLSHMQDHRMAGLPSRDGRREVERTRLRLD
jgi:hypothetical protein